MGLRLESLYPYLVPLTFLAIWALTHLFDRDAEPLPPRVRRPPGPAPLPGPGGRPSPVVSAPVGNGEPRYEFGTRPRPEPRPRPPVPPSPRPPDADKRAAKPAPQRASAPKERFNAPLSLPTLETTVRSLSNELKRPAANPSRLDRMVLPESPFTRPSPLNSTVPERSAVAAPMSPLSEPTARAASIDEIRALLRSPQRLRETIVLNAILSPPIASRRGAFGNRQRG